MSINLKMVVSDKILCINSLNKIISIVNEFKDKELNEEQIEFFNIYRSIALKQLEQIYFV